MLFLVIAIATFVLLSAGLAIFIVKSDRGAKEPFGGLAIAFGFGLLAIGLAIIVEKLLIPNSEVRAIYFGQLPLNTLFGVSLAVGLIEEIAKFVPLALFIQKQKYFNEHNDGLIYFAMSGLAFGLTENLYYLRSAGPIVGLARAGILLFFHPAASATIGYFFARYRLDKKSLFYPLIALFGVAGLHGLYNFGVGSRNTIWLVVSLMVTAALNTGLFLFYRRAVELDQASGLSASGDNAFCRHCGRANPKHFLYCEHCGNQA